MSIIARLVFAVACVMSTGCSSRYIATIYNNTGHDVTLAVAGQDRFLPRDGKWRGVYARTPRGGGDDRLEVIAASSHWSYTKVFGPSASVEFPSSLSGFHNAMQIEPDGSIWYLGGSDPDMKPPFSHPTKEQPAGFPMIPAN